MTAHMLKLINILLLSFSIVFSMASTIAAKPAVDDATRFKTFYEFALISNAAYQSKDTIETTFRKSGFRLTRYGTLPGYGVTYFLATHDALKQHILAVRGTSNAENAMVDAALELLPNKHTGIKLHQGFALSADLIYKDIKADLKPGYRISTTGHSLGGAAALIVAMYMDTDKYIVDKVITFGQPKVTNIQGSQRYSHLNISRVVMPKDMVPLVPPFDPMGMSSDDLTNINIYWHLGSEIVLQTANTYSQLEGLQSMMRATDFLDDTPSELNLQHHFMAQYILSLTDKQKNPQRIPYKNSFNLFKLLGG